MLVFCCCFFKYRKSIRHKLVKLRSHPKTKNLNPISSKCSIQNILLKSICTGYQLKYYMATVQLRNLISILTHHMCCCINFHISVLGLDLLCNTLLPGLTYKNTIKFYKQIGSSISVHYTYFYLSLELENDYKQFNGIMHKIAITPVITNACNLNSLK